MPEPLSSQAKPGNTLMVSDSAFVQRIRRALAKEGLKLKLSMGEMGICLVDEQNNLVAWNCELNKIAHDLRV